MNPILANSSVEGVVLIAAELLVIVVMAGEAGDVALDAFIVELAVTWTLLAVPAKDVLADDDLFVVVIVIPEPIGVDIDISELVEGVDIDMPGIDICARVVPAKKKAGPRRTEGNIVA
jgi:hypothetical protein